MASANLWVNVPDNIKKQIDDGLVELYGSYHYSNQSLDLANYGITDNSMLGSKYVKANSGYNLSYYGTPASDFFDIPFYYKNASIPFSIKGSAPSVPSTITSYVSLNGNGGTYNDFVCKTDSKGFPGIYYGAGTASNSLVKSGNAMFLLLQAGGGGGGNPSYQTAVHGTGGGGGGSGAYALIYVCFKKKSFNITEGAKFDILFKTGNTAANTDGGQINVVYNWATPIIYLYGGSRGNGQSAGAGGTYSVVNSIIDNDYMYIKLVDYGIGAAGGTGGKTNGWVFGVPSSSVNPTAGQGMNRTLAKGYANYTFTLSQTGGTAGATQEYWGGSGGGGAASILAKGCTGSCNNVQPGTPSGYGCGGGGGTAYSYTQNYCNGGTGGGPCALLFTL